MRNRTRCLIAGCISLWLVATPALAEVPPRTHAGQTLQVSEEDLDRGQIFHLLPGEETQIAVTSRAPLKNTVLTSSRAVGYLVGTFDPEDSKQPLLGGALRVPVVTFGSGSPATDRTFRGEDYLDAATHPEMTFEVTSAKDVVRESSDDKDVFLFSLKLEGRLTVRGVTHEVESEAEIHYRLTNFGTFARTAGDLLTLSTRFEVRAEDFDWEVPQADRALVAESFTVHVFLTGSTRSPESSFDPDIDMTRWLSEQRYLTLARDLADADAAAEHGDAYSGKYRDDAAALNSLALAILNTPGLAQRDLSLVRRLVDRAKEIGAEGVDIADTESRLATLRGD